MLTTVLEGTVKRERIKGKEERMLRTRLLRGNLENTMLGEET